ISRHHRALTEIRLSALVGDRSEVHPFSKHAIGESGNGVLLHDHARIAAHRRSHKHWERRVAADPDHGIRFELAKDLPRPENAAHHAHQIANLTHDTDAFDSA